MLAEMQYPHWLMVTGAVLVVLGFIGFVFRRKPDREDGNGDEREQVNDEDQAPACASNTVREIEFAAALRPLEIQRHAVDLMFENFERNQTHLWPHEEDTRGRHPRNRQGSWSRIPWPQSGRPILRG